MSWKHPVRVFASLILVSASVIPYLAKAQSPDEEGQNGQGNSNGRNLIPSLPLPSWISPDLTYFPNNIPRGDTWNPYVYPSNQQGGSNGNSGGGTNGLLSLVSGALGGGKGGGSGGTGGLLSLVSGALRGGRIAAAPGGQNGMAYSYSDPRNCLINNPKLNILQVVPGIGWDNLRNSETGLLTSFSYSKCKVTYDRKYLIPDETFAIPIKTSTIDRKAELFDHWDRYKSVTSRSINTGFDIFGKIGGKFSTEYQRIKSKQYSEKAITMRVELRHRFYTIKQLPDAALHPGFKARLLEIASFLKTNDTNSADYAAQVLIRDYGTHCLTSIDAGAVLIKEDNLKSTIMSSYKGRADSLTTAAGVELYDLLKLRASAGFSTYSGEADLKAYRDNQTSSKLYTYGGPPFKLGMALSTWEDNLSNNLVATDRSGRPIHSLISSQTMKPEMNDPNDIFRLKRLLKDAVSRYYDFNTHIGCTDPKAPNFDYQANDDLPGVCKEPSANYTFGGVFQKCRSNGRNICGGLLQKNPLTGGYSCPDGFKALLLHSTKTSRDKMKQVCKKERKCSFLIFNCRDVNNCKWVPSVETGVYQTYWCAPNKKNPRKLNGYMFGGIYSNDLHNPITRSRSCPTHFIPLKIGSQATVCVSEDYELGHQFSLPFGGFFSCLGGNILATNNSSDFLNNPNDWPMRCPGGFTQHLALTEKGCRVNFCVKAGALLKASDLEIVLPPFDRKPLQRPNSTSEFYSQSAIKSPYGSGGVIVQSSPAMASLTANSNGNNMQPPPRAVYYMPMSASGGSDGAEVKRPLVSLVVFGVVVFLLLGGH